MRSNLLDSSCISGHVICYACEAEYHLAQPPHKISLDNSRRNQHTLSARLFWISGRTAMKHFPLPWFRVVTTLSHNPLALLGGVLLCVSPALAPAQNVTFAG